MAVKFPDIHTNRKPFIKSAGKGHDGVCAELQGMDGKVSGPQINGAAVFHIPANAAPAAVVDFQKIGFRPMTAEKLLSLMAVKRSCNSGKQFLNILRILVAQMTKFLIMQENDPPFSNLPGRLRILRFIQGS